MIFSITYEDGSVENLQYIKVIDIYRCYCILINPSLENNYIFKTLGITDAKAFVSSIVGYTVGGSWPKVYTEEDFEKVLKYLECYLEM